MAVFVPACLFFAGSIVLLFGVRTAWCILRIVGVGGLVVMIVTLVCERIQALPWMGWRPGNSPGHYVDLSRAVVAVTLFPLGYLGACS